MADAHILTALRAALDARGFAGAEPQLAPIEPPRDWGVTTNVCFALAGRAAQAQIAEQTAGLDKKEAKALAGQITREAGPKLAAELAGELSEQLGSGGARVEAEGAYINFYYDPVTLAGEVVRQVLAGESFLAPKNVGEPFLAPEEGGINTSPTKAGEEQRSPAAQYGAGTHTGRKIMVEYAQPNTHKDFHVGHLRNASIGQAIANLLEFEGNQVLKATYIGDVGAHVARAHWAAEEELIDKSEWFHRLGKLAAAVLFYGFTLPIDEASNDLNGPQLHTLLEKDHIEALSVITKMVYDLDAHINYGMPFPAYDPYSRLSSDWAGDADQFAEDAWYEEVGRPPHSFGEMNSLTWWGNLYRFATWLANVARSLYNQSIRIDHELMRPYQEADTTPPEWASLEEDPDSAVYLLRGLSDDLNEFVIYTKFGPLYWLRAWESGNSEKRSSWLDVRNICLQAFRQIFEELEISFENDCWFFESTVDDSDLGQQTAEELKQRGIAVVDESPEYKGALYVDFEQQADAVRMTGTESGPTGMTGTESGPTEEPVFRDDERKRIRKLGKMIILRSDGTSLYQTKELGLAKYKFDHFDIDESLYVVGSEQKLYFEQVFAILRLWGFPNAENCKHIAYELVVLPEGKMSSREGTVVSYRELRDEAKVRAEQVIREKGLINDEEQIKSVRDAVAIAAIKYAMLQVSGNQQIVFDFEQALSFDGRAAPYLQYAYARAGKLVDPVGTRPAASAESQAETPVPPVPASLQSAEIALVRQLHAWPAACRLAAQRYEPAVIANYLYELASAFNDFYRDCRVLDAPDDIRPWRQNLTAAFREVMRTGFDLLALPLPEAM